MSTTTAAREAAFETPRPVVLVVRVPAGHVRLCAEDRATTEVTLRPLDAAGADAVGGAVVEQRGDTVVVDLDEHGRGLLRRTPHVEVVVACPTGSTLEVSTGSADVTAAGSWRDAVLTSGSGDLSVEEVTGSTRVKAGSGDLAVGTAGQALQASTGSGDVTLGRLDGDAVCRTGSGDVTVDAFTGSLTTKSGSGSLTVRRASEGVVHSTGASGDVTIGIERGTAAWLDCSTISGRVRQELDTTGAPAEGTLRLEITAQTVSGDVRVHRS